MKIVLDACVLYPTVMREVILGVAAQRVFVPAWSLRILEEWARAARKHGAVQEMQARGEIALARAAFPDAVVAPAPGIEARLWLPDAADIHVLATAVAGSADAIMTLNAKDFPKGALAEEGLTRIEPDGYLHAVWQASPSVMEEVCGHVLQNARAMSQDDWDMRRLLKKARLPRLAKALG